MGAMDPYLVCAAGFEAAGDQGGPEAEPLLHLVVGAGRLTARLLHHGHLLPVAGASADIALDDARGRRGRSPDDSPVHPVDRVVRELRGEPGMGGIVLSHDKKAAGILIDAAPA